MLEVGKYVTASRQVLPNPSNHASAFFIRISWLAKPVINKRPGDHIRGGSFFRFGDTESGSRGLQQIPRRIGEPGIVTKFKRCRQGARQKRDKILEQRRIRLQIRRQLEQHRAELSSGGQRFDGCEKAGNKIFGSLQSLDVGDYLVCLHAESKRRGRLLNPVLN